MLVNDISKFFLDLWNQHRCFCGHFCNVPPVSPTYWMSQPGLDHVIKYTRRVVIKLRHQHEKKYQISPTAQFVGIWLTMPDVRPRTLHFFCDKICPTGSRVLTVLLLDPVLFYATYLSFLVLTFIYEIDLRSNILLRLSITTIKMLELKIVTE